MSKCYDFYVTVCGWGDTIEEAWERSKEGFDIDNESMPEDYLLIDEDDEETTNS